MQWKLNRQGDLLTNGENLLQGKNPIQRFLGHQSQESTNQEQAVTSIKYLITTLDYPKIPTYSWTFTPIPNWTWSYRDFFLYAWIPVYAWLPNNWLIIVSCKVLHFKAHWRFGSTWLQNPKAHKNIVASHKLYEFSYQVSVSLMTLK